MDRSKYLSFAGKSPPILWWVFFMDLMEGPCIGGRLMNIQEIRNLFIREVSLAKNAKDLDSLHVHFLGRNGVITKLPKKIDFGKLTEEEKRGFGSGFNELKNFADRMIKESRENLETSKKLFTNTDLTLPGTDRTIGHLHPISLVQMELEEIFQGMGFMMLSGNEVETEYYNFDALNVPSNHPARDMQDTYWLTNNTVLRTHTSANQVRTLEKYDPPIRAIFPGRCFRCEKLDAGHENTFHQLEGLMVDRDVSIANLIAVMKAFLSRVFRKDMSVRLRPGFFPYVEPGFELDIKCVICNGGGCATCKRSGWVELVPCGLVHPKVLEYGGVDPSEYSGFAFGLGLTRLAMMKYSIPEIRLFNSGDIRFYSQFPEVI
jgi:phenylalanyl-tRNA synthetase alpha chain